MKNICNFCGHGVGAHPALGCLRQGCKCPGFESKEPAAPVKETQMDLFGRGDSKKEDKRYPD